MEKHTTYILMRAYACTRTHTVPPKVNRASKSDVKHRHCQPVCLCTIETLYICAGKQDKYIAHSKTVQMSVYTL